MSEIADELVVLPIQGKDYQLSRWVARDNEVLTEEARKAHPLQRWDSSAAFTTSISGLLLRPTGRQL